MKSSHSASGEAAAAPRQQAWVLPVQPTCSGAAAHAPHERSALCERGGDFGGAVVGIVVDDGDAKFPGRIGLGDEAFQARPDVQRFVAGRHDHFDRGRVRSGRRISRNEGSQSGALAQCPHEQERFQEQQRCGEKQLQGGNQSLPRGRPTKACNASNRISVPSFAGTDRGAVRSCTAFFAALREPNWRPGVLPCP